MQHSAFNTGPISRVWVPLSLCGGAPHSAASSSELPHSVRAAACAARIPAFLLFCYCIFPLLRRLPRTSVHDYEVDIRQASMAGMRGAESFLSWCPRIRRRSRHFLFLDICRCFFFCRYTYARLPYFSRLLYCYFPPPAVLLPYF